MTRSDLLALTPDALAALANRGLVKRATKDLDAGNAPTIGLDGDGTVRGTFGDGVETTLPGGGGLEGATCTCAATGVCRHQIGLVLAYQREAPAEQEEAAEDGPSGWSPGSFDDDALTRALGERAVTAARRTLKAGYAARVHRPREAREVASADLPTCTVRFLVPGEFGYVHTDAVAARRGEVIALAVWAFRAADERDPDAADVTVQVGGGPSGESGTSGLEPVLPLVEQVLLDGARHTGPVLGTALHRASRELTGKGLHWPAAALDELAAQVDAYHARDAAHETGRVAALLAEPYARHRAALHTGGSPRARVLGTDEAGETPLSRVRLTALGCRIGGTGRRTAEVYLAHPATGLVLVLKRNWKLEDDQVLTGHELAGRRVAGAPLRTLAAANIVSENATRGPSRVVRISTGRVFKTTVTPLGASWADLPAALLARDLDALERELAHRPPRPIRPRVEAESARVLEIADVRSVGYHPGAQTLEATVTGAGGGTAVVSAAYAPSRPGALDALAAALESGPTHISGAVHRSRGRLTVDCFGVLTADGPVIPDLAAGAGDGTLAAPAGEAADPLAALIAAALDACAEAAHRGLRHVPPGTRARLERAARDLDRAGLSRCAAALTALAAALGGDASGTMVRTWVDCQIRLMATAEQR